MNVQRSFFYYYAAEKFAASFAAYFNICTRQSAV